MITAYVDMGGSSYLLVEEFDLLQMVRCSKEYFVQLAVKASKAINDPDSLAMYNVAILEGKKFATLEARLNDIEANFECLKLDELAD